MEKFTYNALTIEEMAEVNELMKTHPCPVGIKKFEDLELCSGQCCDGCVMPGDGIRCWELVKGKKPFPWWMVEAMHRAKARRIKEQLRLNEIKYKSQFEAKKAKRKKG